MTIRRFIATFSLVTAAGLFVATGPVVKPISIEGGISGRVIRVTTLRPDGPGSLRAALQRSDPRLVIFDVAGVIDLGGATIVVEHPDLMLAGQTAPDPGITVIRGSIVVATHDVVIQHIAVRPGDGVNGAADALGAVRGHDVVFDHCSATWAIDENLSVSGPADESGPTSHDVILRHCLIAEGLSHATHPKGEHSKGTLIHDGVRNVTITGCVYAHNRQRNPRLKGGTATVVTANVMYDWGDQCVGVGARGNRRMLKPAEATIAGNVAIAGPSTTSPIFVKSVDPGARVCLGANVALNMQLADAGVVMECGGSPPPSIDPWHAAAETLRTAGARPARRDPIDARIIQSIIDGTGRIIDSQEQAGGYPVRAQTTRKLVVPKDRRRWLDQLSNELNEDKRMNVQAFLERLRH